MIQREIWRLVERDLLSHPSGEALFNPYLSNHAEADKLDGHLIRQANLRAYFRSLGALPPVLIVGEASGPWGCRFSGVPFTSERQLCSGLLPFRGRQSSQNVEPYHERTAGIFWDVLAPYYPRCFIWNAVPLHTHLPGEPFSLRRPMLSEVRQFQDLLADITAAVSPAKIIAVGRIAQRAVRNIGMTPCCVRHPSHGGMREFRAGIEAALTN